MAKGAVLKVSKATKNANNIQCVIPVSVLRHIGIPKKGQKLEWIEGKLGEVILRLKDCD